MKLKNAMKTCDFRASPANEKYDTVRGYISTITRVMEGASSTHNPMLPLRLWLRDMHHFKMSTFDISSRLHPVFFFRLRKVDYSIILFSLHLFVCVSLISWNFWQGETHVIKPVFSLCITQLWLHTPKKPNPSLTFGSPISVDLSGGSKADIGVISGPNLLPFC